jgi:hypothetical protein
MQYPSTPEGVALVIWRTLLRRGWQPPPDKPMVCAHLDLFAECLRTAEGDRVIEKKPAH